MMFRSMRQLALCNLLAALLAACGSSSASPAPSKAASPNLAASKTSVAASSAAAQATSPSLSAAAKASGSSGGQPGSSSPKIIVSYSEVSPAHLQVWVAKEAGILQKNGLDVDLRLIESTTGVPAVMSGEIQIGQFGGSEALAAAVGGASLVVTGTLSPVFPYTFLVAPDIKTKQDLIGKKVGVSKIGSSSDTALRAGLTKFGVNPNKDVTIISVGSRAAQTAAAQSGAVQGELSHPPDSLDLEKIGWRQLFDLASLDLTAANATVVANRTWLKDHKDVMQKFIDSDVQAEALAKKDPAATKKVLQQYLKVSDDATLQETYDFYVGKVLSVLPYPKPEQFANALEQLAEQNAKAKSFDVASFLDDSFVKSAAARGLDK